MCEQCHSIQCGHLWVIAQVHEYDGAGVALAMYNTEASIRGFATASFEYALDRQWYVQGSASSLSCCS